MQLTEIELQYIVVDNMGLGHFFYYFSQKVSEIFIAIKLQTYHFTTWVTILRLSNLKYLDMFSQTWKEVGRVSLWQQSQIDTAQP